MKMTRLSGLARATLSSIACIVFFTSCESRRTGDPDADRRRDWLNKEAEANKELVRATLNGTDDIQFYDGWYNIERDEKTGGAWRWMERRGILRLRSRPSGARAARDMDLHVFGWVPHEHAPLRQLRIELAVNGHVLERFDPPPAAFEHVVVVPRWLLERSEWVDLSITVANSARPSGEWRELGFATTGFHWKPVPPS